MCPGFMMFAGLQSGKMFAGSQSIRSGQLSSSIFAFGILLEASTVRPGHAYKRSLWCAPTCGDLVCVLGCVSVLVSFDSQLEDDSKRRYTNNQPTTILLPRALPAIHRQSFGQPAGGVASLTSNQSAPSVARPLAGREWRLQVDISDMQWRPNCSLQLHSSSASLQAPSTFSGSNAIVWEIRPWQGALADLEWGITLALQYVLGMVAELVKKPETQYILLPRLPNCSPRCSSSTGIALEELLDLEYLEEEVRHYRASIGLGPIVLSSYDSAFSPSATHQRYETHAGNSKLKLLLLGAIRPSPCMRSILELMRRSGPAVESRLCLHNRIEADFRCSFQHPPGYFTIDEIANKLRHAATSNTELVGISSVYLAGASDYDDVLAAMAERSGIQTITTKRLLLTGGTRGESTPTFDYHCERQHIKDSRAADGFSNSFLAMVDFFFCAESAVFVGNNHSSWSGVVYVWRAARQRRLGTPLNALQVNELTLSNKLYSFCEPNWSAVFGPHCKYERFN